MFFFSFLFIPLFVENYRTNQLLINFDKEPLFLKFYSYSFIFYLFLLFPWWLPVIPSIVVPNHLRYSLKEKNSPLFLIFSWLVTLELHINIPLLIKYSKHTYMCCLFPACNIGFLDSNHFYTLIKLFDERIEVATLFMKSTDKRRKIYGK